MIRAATGTRPAIRHATDPNVPWNIDAAEGSEIVLDGLTLEAVERATAEGIRAGCRPGILQITAGNYGGKLGPFHIRLHDTLRRYSALAESD